MFMFAVLLFVAISNAYDKSLLNEFSADVDIYHMGMMGRGKNAGSWNRSLKNKQEVFYYLAMQPWRHLVWTDCTGTECFKYFINEDASSIPNKDGKTKLSNSDPNQDYCRKEYANPMSTFDIDWNQIDPNGRLEAVDINGQTCYKYPAQQPLAHIFLQQQYLKENEVTAMTPCRYDFIGGKSITFRSFNTFNPTFIGEDPINGYKVNKTRCNIDPTPNNVDTDIAIILGIADANIVQTINPALAKLGDLTTVKQVTVYYLSGESLKKETIALKNLDSLKSKSITLGPVDALINSAKNDLAKRVNAKAIYRGTIIVLMDRTLSSTFDAETAFDRNNITVHAILYNPKGDNQMRIRARSLLSVGEHYHEFTSSTGISSVVNEMFVGVRANLTERCNRTSCDGFCDGRDRCTCPMCCENTCYFSYCNVTTATCKAWPEAKPKAKITCKSDCVGKQECLDLQGCVYTEYKEGCAPRAKCMKPHCDEKTQKCYQESSCESDKTPSFENKCWSYNCNEQNGVCERAYSGEECPKLPDLCHEYVCDSKLKCSYQKKVCVKTSPYVEMECYKAECNKRTGMCENVLNCTNALASYTGCGKTGSASLCKCNKDFTCSCTGNVNQAQQNGYCSSEQICDSSDESKAPYCRKSNCHQDLFIDGCQVKTCDEDTGEIEWVEYDCKKNVTIQAGGANADKATMYCLDKFEIICDNGECLGQIKNGETLEAACGFCAISDAVVTNNGWKKTYTVTYDEDCNYLKLTCPNGKPIKDYENLLKEDEQGNVNIGKCVSTGEKDQKNNDIYKCVYNYKDDIDFANKGFDICSECYDTATCYKNADFRTYKFDEEAGTCSMTVNYEVQPKCSECNKNKDGFDLLCRGKTVEKTWSTAVGTKEVQFQYTIPKVCYPGDQCIPNPNFDCSDRANGDIAKIYNLLGVCAQGEDSITAEYHYSSLFDFNRYVQEIGQKQEFLDEAEREAYCTWSYSVEDCHYCVLNEVENAADGEPKYTASLKDKCDDLQQEYVNDENVNANAFEFKCDKPTNECKATLIETECPKKDCFHYFQNAAGECENTGIGTCKTHEDKRDGKLAKYTTRNKLPLEHEDLEITCSTTIKCSEEDQITCNYDEFSTECEQAYSDYMNGVRDFGCRRPVANCNFTDLHCTFVEFNLTNPADDIRFFYERDNVVFNDLCYQYTCEEYVNTTTGKIEHHWVQTPESLAELNKKPETICDTVKCNPLSGKSESERRQCNPVEDYGLTETMAMCFQCACSMMTGENVLTMRPNTIENTYELDACGNCVVKDRATGQQVNEVIPCVLAQPVNLTGAIAGATVAASVVFGLIGSMVVVSIGAFQTYQLVSSAMKNVISTTLENPEFVAADNEATNVLNNE